MTKTTLTRFRKALKAERVTQDMIAANAGVTRSAVCSTLNGHMRSAPILRTAVKLFRDNTPLQERTAPTGKYTRLWATLIDPEHDVN